jgi:hypothetical protein
MAILMQKTRAVATIRVLAGQISVVGFGILACGRKGQANLHNQQHHKRQHQHQRQQQ